jgi:hypothetical protein
MLTIVPESAFDSCGALTDVRLPEGVTTIQARAFYECRALTGFVLPGSLRFIGRQAFHSCFGLSELVLPTKLESIGEGAFAECRGLSRMDLPDGVTSIADDTFAHCIRLAHVSLGSGLRFLDPSAFFDCPELREIHVSPSNPTFASVDGVLFDKPRDTLIKYPPRREGAYIIPSQTTRIGDHAFAYCEHLTSVVLSDSVTDLGVAAFFLCRNLADVTVGTGISLLPEEVFSGCRSLQKISIPDTVTAIEARALASSGLERVIIPSSVTSIGDGAFAACQRLRAISLSPLLVSIGAECFYESGLREIELPASLTTIGERAFAYSALTRLTIPDGVAFLDHYCFTGCNALTSVTLGTGVRWVGSFVFTECAALQQVVFTGEAPIGMGPYAYQEDLPAAAFTIVYFQGRQGFSSPTWREYQSVMIDAADEPVVQWLAQYGYRYDTELGTDPDGDDVSLLMAYALDLDPHRHPAASLPKPELGPDGLQIDFHATTPGIRYRVETSEDLARWTTEGVVVASPGPDHRSTAIVARNAPTRFLRLVVAED